MFVRIPPASLEVLKALSYFHYLTNEQLVELGVANSVHSLNAWAMQSLVPKRDRLGNVALDKGKLKAKYLCNNLRFGGDAERSKQGKQPYIHFMTEAGRNYLYWACEDELLNSEDIWIPKPKDALSNDYFHRIDYVTAHIRFRKWAAQSGAVIDFAHHDYQGDPNRPLERGRPVSINQIVWDERTGKKAKPDGIYGIDYKGKKRLFLVEMHKSTATKQVLEQIGRNFNAAPAINAKFHDYPTPNDPFVLSVHYNHSTLKATKRRALEIPALAPFLPGLMFAHLDDLRDGFAGAWSYADDREVKMFQ